MFSDSDISNYKLGVFTANYRKIQEHNAKGESYTMGVNQFMDLTHDEFDKIYLTLITKKTSSPYG